VQSHEIESSPSPPPAQDTPVKSHEGENSHSSPPAQDTPVQSHGSGNSHSPHDPSKITLTAEQRRTWCVQCRERKRTFEPCDADFENGIHCTFCRNKWHSPTELAAQCNRIEPWGSFETLVREMFPLDEVEHWCEACKVKKKTGGKAARCNLKQPCGYCQAQHKQCEYEG
jgi:hypothetical protein